MLFDTDIGTDIDDAVCLAYLLAQPACELLGITTVSGEPTKRAMLASALCRAAGKDIPIFPGTEEPLLIEQRQPRAQQADALGDWPHEESFPQGATVEFLRQTVRAHPGEITLVAVGPLTNIGLLFCADPEIPRLLKGLVLMCGQFFGRGVGRGPVEWNASCDPHAAAIVYRSTVASHRSHGLDVTRQVRMSAKEVRARFRAPLLRPVAAFAEVFFQRREEITFHDPLAATTIFDDRICTFATGNVQVELESRQLQASCIGKPTTLPVVIRWRTQLTLIGSLHTISQFSSKENSMFQGKVLGIYTAPARREPMVSQQDVRVVPGKGIEGDRYFKGNATYSDRPGPHRELTLIELETIDALEREYGYRLEPDLSRRNLLVSGVPLNHLIDREFTIGGVRVRGILLCEPCANLAETSGHSNIINHMMHRGGLRAEILTEGVIQVGADISPGSEE